MRPSSITAALYLLLVFLSGILLGGFGVGLYNARSVSAGRSMTKQDDPRHRWERDMQKRLNLTPDQSTQLGAILKDTRERYRALSKKWEPEANAIMDHQYQAIRAILNEDQKTEYEKMRQEREQHRRENQKNRPPR
jgi:Spy/CpxP family protein refolding chaperone